MSNGNGNTLMLSLLGLGVGAIAYGLMRECNNNGNNNMVQLVQRVAN